MLRWQMKTNTIFHIYQGPNDWKKKELKEEEHRVLNSLQREMKEKFKTIV